MEVYEQNLHEEEGYLETTLKCIRKELDKEIELLSDRRIELIKVRKEMWENTVHFSTDFERLTEITQYLTVLDNQTSGYGGTLKQIRKYERMLDSPYFGRFDFVEDGEGENEKIYVGLYNVIDSETYDILVYDWRAPISSIFYEHELGDATYKVPKGIIKGNVLLKRQYSIDYGKIKYFFDSSVKIDDDILKDVLCRNSSTKMRNIVETIQKEQNAAIRDIDSELLIVQGVAGSGKTSIALHRIAFLLYQGVNNKLSTNNIIIISPNEVFSKYISSVLPELGEEKVNQITFDEICSRSFGNNLKIEKRSEQLEYLISCGKSQKLNNRGSSIDFKGSKVFKEILDRFLKYYEHNLIKFQDIYYDGKIIETRELLKNSFLSDKIGMPISKRLKRMENILLHKIHPLQRKRTEKIERLVQRIGGHELEIRPFSRLLSIKESSGFAKKIRQFTEVDSYKAYEQLFKDEQLFIKLAYGLKVPDNVKDIISATIDNLKKGIILYEDCAPLLYLKIKIEGNDMFSEIKQVVIDEAQDYSTMHYEVFNLLFKESRFTVLGDVNQSIDKETKISIYNEIDEILNKKRSIQIMLNKSYRSSYEINNFTQKILELHQESISFDRHEDKPLVVFMENEEKGRGAIIKSINNFLEEGFGTVAVISKTLSEAERLYNNLKSMTSIKLIKSKDDEVESGVMVIPAYMAKGLEFDAVIVHDASTENYSSDIDRKLLYVACTRALHRLIIYYTGQKSIFVPEI